MANHRLQVVDRRPKFTAVLAALPSMDRQSKSIILLRLLLFTVGMSAVMYVSVGWIPATTWLILSLLETAVLVFLFGADDRAVKQWKEHEAAMMDRVASQPGGAPLIADVSAHCGCVHRFAYDEVKDRWLQVTMMDLNQHCPLVEGYSS